MSDLQKQIKSLIAKIEKADPEIIIYIDRLEARCESQAKELDECARPKIRVDGEIKAVLSCYYSVKGGDFPFLGEDARDAANRIEALEQDLEKKSVKKTNKQKARAVKKKAGLDKNMKENPDWCFCEELLGKDPDIDPRTDPVIDTIQGYGGPLRNAMIDYDVYKCKRCGKKAHINIVFA